MSDNYFGVRRKYKIKFGDFEIYGDPFCPGIERRSWKERLFSRPWRPLKAYKPADIVYFLPETNQIITSIKTFIKIETAALTGAKDE
jgi:hypothetical protein